MKIIIPKTPWHGGQLVLDGTQDTLLRILIEMFKDTRSKVKGTTGTGGRLLIEPYETEDRRPGLIITIWDKRNHQQLSSAFVPDRTWDDQGYNEMGSCVEIRQHLIPAQHEMLGKLYGGIDPYREYTTRYVLSFTKDEHRKQHNVLDWLRRSGIVHSVEPKYGYPSAVRVEEAEELERLANEEAEVQLARMRQTPEVPEA